MLLLRALILFLSLTALTACSTPLANFSQFAGFADYFAQHPPNKALPSRQQRALLEQFKPHFYLAKDQTQPLDFYHDYIANGSLYQLDEQGAKTLISDQVDQTLLNRYKGQALTVFEYNNATTKPNATAYGRIDYDELKLSNGNALALVFLTYNLVFAHSGLPAGMAGINKTGLAALGMYKDWHQLDHYTAVSIALHATTLQPLAISIQQHNNLRTYLAGEDTALSVDGVSLIDIALNSNELYPHRLVTSRWRVVPFVSSDNVDYFITGEDAPLLSADDVTQGEQALDYQLQYLAPADAFYMFNGWLGERRNIPGRDGPPGASYKAPPELLPPAKVLALTHWHENDQLWIDFVKKYRFGSTLQGPEVTALRNRFEQKILALIKH